MTDFEKKGKLIAALLDHEFGPPGMSEEDGDKTDVERQIFAMRMGGRERRSPNWKRSAWTC